MKAPPRSSADVKVDHDSTQEPAQRSTSRLDGTETLRHRAGGAKCLESDKAILAVYKSLDDENSGHEAMRCRQQAAESTA